MRAKRRHNGTDAAVKIANAKSCACHDHSIANEAIPTRIAASPSHIMNEPGTNNSSASRTAPRITHFHGPNEPMNDIILASVMSLLDRSGAAPWKVSSGHCE